MIDRRSLLKSLGVAAVSSQLGHGQRNQNTDPKHTAATPAIDQFYDLVVVGGTPGGIACAVRAARQGLTVLLVNRTAHLGGFISSGAGIADTQYDNGYEGGRSPLFGEFSQAVLDHYRTTYGANSPQYAAAHWGPRKQSGSRLRFESHVAESICNQMVSKESRITLLKGYCPLSVLREGRTIVAVSLTKGVGSADNLRVTGRVFVDATYEGDLMALAGVPYKVGRESREEYSEPHAGKIFAQTGFSGNHPYAATIGKLNLRPFRAVTQQIFAGSTGAGDGKIQSYQIRLCLSCDPNNRRYVDKPTNYDPGAFEYAVGRYGYGVSRSNGPNQKAYWNRNMPGIDDSYPEAAWPERKKLYDQQRDFILGFLYFLQHDPSVPIQARQNALEWGLARDEFVDNDNVPYEMYVREARRMVGRYVFTELDASIARGFDRTPNHEDSIGIGEWFMDSHEVSTEKQAGSDADGKIILSELTRPSQIPYRSLLPQDLDNLLVPVALSATHVGWGTIRLEPTWMHIGESAGFAAALAIKTGRLPGNLPISRLQRLLAESGVMLSFFNDFDMQTKARWTAAVQYLGTKGFFDSYDARPSDVLSFDAAREWARSTARLASAELIPDDSARGLAKLPGEVHPISGASFKALLINAFEYWNTANAAGMAYLRNDLKASDRHLTRGEGAQMIYELLSRFDC